MWQLIINGPGYFDTAYDLREGVTHVGRADENDIVLSGDLVSRKHARFHVKEGELSLEDLGSRNGSRLNGQSATGTGPLKAGDVVNVGENALTVRALRESEAPETEVVDTGGGGRVKRFGRGLDIRDAVLMTRDVKESSVLKALDNLAPFDNRTAPPIKRRRPSDTDETPQPTQAVTGEIEPTSGVAVESLVLLYRVADALARARTLQPFLDETTDLVMRRVGATTGVVLLRHRSGVMVPAAVRHSKKLQRGEVPVSDAILDAALGTGQALAVSDVRDDARFAARESVVVYGIDQVLCIPLGRAAPFLGVLYLNRASSEPEAVEGLLDVCTAVSQLLQSGIEKFEIAPGSADDRARLVLERFYSPAVTERYLRERKAAATEAPLAGLDERQVTVAHFELSGLPRGPLLGKLLGEFQRLTTQLCFSFEGAVQRFDGEAATVVFGAPTARSDDGIRAVRASLAIATEWVALSARLAKTPVPLKVGLNSGKAVVGLVGTEQRLDLQVLGEVPTLARLLAASADAGQVLLTGKALAAVGARFDVTPLGERALLGSKVRTAVFEVLDEDSDSGTLSGIR
jgi:class 3 adenylate cyclase